MEGSKEKKPGCETAGGKMLFELELCEEEHSPGEIGGFRGVGGPIGAFSHIPCGFDFSAHRFLLAEGSLWSCAAAAGGFLLGIVLCLVLIRRQKAVRWREPAFPIAALAVCLHGKGRKIQREQGNPQATDHRPALGPPSPIPMGEPDLTEHQLPLS